MHFLFDRVRRKVENITRVWGLWIAPPFCNSIKHLASLAFPIANFHPCQSCLSAFGFFYFSQFKCDTSKWKTSILIRLFVVRKEKSCKQARMCRGIIKQNGENMTDTIEKPYSRDTLLGFERHYSRLGGFECLWHGKEKLHWEKKQLAQKHAERTLG